MSQALKDYEVLARKIVAVLEEAIVNTASTSDLIYIGGKDGLVLNRSNAESLLRLLKEHEEITDEKQLKEAVYQSDYPVIICDENSVFFKFQSLVEEICKDVK